MRAVNMAIRPFVPVLALLLASMAGEAGAAAFLELPGSDDAPQSDPQEANAYNDDDIELFLGSRYTRVASERGAQVALEASLFDALELGLAAGYDEDRLPLQPGEHRSDERTIELSAGWAFIELDPGVAFALVLENAWTRADEGLFREDEAEGTDDTDEDDEPAGDPASRVERGVELHVGLAAEVELGERVVAVAELFRERIDGDGPAVSTTGREIGIDVLLTPRLTLGGSAARLRAAGEATEYSLGLAWAASKRIVLGVEGSRRTAEPDQLSFAIALRLR